MTCPNCEQLKIRIEELELQINNKQHVAYDALYRLTGVTPNEAGIVMHLYNAKGRPLDKFFLHDNRVTARDAGAISPDDIKVYVSRIRKKMGADAVVTGPYGYMLGDRGRQLVDLALKVAT